MTGLFAAIAKRGVTSISIRSDLIDESVKASYDRLLERAPELGLNIRFAVRQNSSGESSTVHEAIASAGLRNIISIDNPEFQHIRLQPTKLEQIINLDELPGGASLYYDLAEAFLSHYNEGMAAVG
jgi:hypothetical protein